jgi:hypothetical protein
MEDHMPLAVETPKATSGSSSHLPESKEGKRPMKKGLRIAGGTVIGLALVLLILRGVGLGPHGLFPGLWLPGEVVSTPVTDWTFVESVKEGPHEAGGYPLVQVQTRERFFPLLPYSFHVSCMVLDRNLYIGALYVAGVEYPNGRHWNKNIVRDPHVRLKIGNKLYDQTLVRVTDPAEDAALVKAWNLRRAEDADPGMTKIWFRVMPKDAAGAE